MALNIEQSTSVLPNSGIGAVIVARMNSSRLPGKSMALIEGRPALEWIVRRLKRSRYIARFVIATTEDPSDDPIAELAGRLECDVFRGSEEDVLGRVVRAVALAKLDIVVHVTGDCPLVDPALADACIDAYQANRVDYVSIDLDAYPQGLDVEVFGADVLTEVASSFTDPWIREHVTLPLYTMSERFTAMKVSASPELQRHEYRICVDTPEDLDLVRRVFASLLPDGEDFGARDVVRLLRSRPDLVAINAELTETKHPSAVIGLGRIGSLYQRQPFAKNCVQTHAKAYLAYGKTHLVAGCDTSVERRADFVSDWKIEDVYSSAQDMFARHRISIVSIATPAASHAELCLEAVDAGVRAIFCEKPFTADPEQARRVVEICDHHNVLLAVNFWRRWSNLYRSMREFIRGGGLGEIQSVRGHSCKGALNSGSHAVDLVRFLFGEIGSVLATESICTDTGDDDIGGVLRMNDGLTVHLTIGDYRDHFDFEIDVIGARGRIRSTDAHVEYWRVEQSPSEPDINVLAPAEAPFDTEIGTPFQNAVAELVAHVDGRSSHASCTGMDGLIALQVIHAMQRSWATGSQWVSCESSGDGKEIGIKQGQLCG